MIPAKLSATGLLGEWLCKVIRPNKRHYTVVSMPLRQYVLEFHASEIELAPALDFLSGILRPYLVFVLVDDATSTDVAKISDGSYSRLN